MARRPLAPVEVITLDPRPTERQLKQREADRERQARDAAALKASKAREAEVKEATAREEADREARKVEAERKRNLGAGNGTLRPADGMWDDGFSKSGG